MTVIKAILIDFDGVIRHWDNQSVGDFERGQGLPAGGLFSVAFESGLLSQAITGGISHQQWEALVMAKLSTTYSANIAEQWIDCWQRSRYQIDHDFLTAIKARAGNAELVLVTNATDKLTGDLAEAAMSDAFDHVMNSSELGVAKPDTGFYEAVFQKTGAKPAEVIFIDDSVMNVTAASQLGCRAIHHQKTDETLAFIDKVFFG